MQTMSGGGGEGRGRRDPCPKLYNGAPTGCLPVGQATTTTNKQCVRAPGISSTCCPYSLQPAGVSSLLPLLPLSPHGGGTPTLGNSQCSWADRRLTTGTPFLPSLSSTALPPWKERGRDCTPAECVREWMRVCPCVGWVKVPESRCSAGSVGAAYSHPKGQQPSWASLPLQHLPGHPRLHLGRNACVINCTHIMSLSAGTR